MMTDKTKGSAHTEGRAAKKRRKSEILSTCPVNGAGWCPYPFSISQLRKRMKNVAAASNNQEPAEAASARVVRTKAR